MDLFMNPDGKQSLREAFMAEHEPSSSSTTTSNASGEAAGSSVTLLSLPNELLLQILSLLPGHDLARVSCTNHRLNLLASSPHLWASFVRAFQLTSPAPYPSYKILFACLHQHIWLRPGLWHSDRRFTGLVIATRYNATSGHIELYQVLAPPNTAAPPTPVPWSHDPSVLLSTFTPTVKLWTEPLLSLGPSLHPDPVTGEVTYPSTSAVVSTTLLRAVPIAAESQTPNLALWPPPHTLPLNVDRARNASLQPFRSASPTVASETLFHLRHQLRFHATHEMSQVETFSTLSPSWYTPTPETPLRGVWVGDYSMHGPELVLFLQDAGGAGVRALKLSGDINVPRGECTFAVDDLQHVLRIAEEQEWPGAKVVKARGQIANTHFSQPQWIDCEFIWISNDAVAFHWVFPPRLTGGLRSEKISRFYRVDVNRFLWGDGVQKFSQDNEGC